MNHQQAVDSMAVERYVLNEMTATDRQAFEEHYFNCPECLEAITYASDFLEVGREIELEKKEQQNTVPGWYTRLFTGSSELFRPLPALAFALVLFGFFAANIYQYTTLHKQQAVIAKLNAPKQEFRFVIAEAARNSGTPRGVGAELNVPRMSQMNIVFQFKPGPYTRYRAEIKTANGTVKSALDFDMHPFETSTTISLPAVSLPPGEYSVALLAQSENGIEQTLASESFQLRFVD